MKSRPKTRKQRSILVKVFLVIVALTISTILFILAFSALLVNKPNQLYAHIHLVITLVILVTVGFLVAHFLIRRILKPLSVLNDAVEDIGKGNLDQKIKVNTNDELGSLAFAINNMTTDIKKMIIAREHLLLDVSHELRTPITRAKLALEMMPESTTRESLAGDLREMESMVTEILESERLKSGRIALNITHVKAGDVLQKVLSYYQAETDRIVLFPVSDDLILDVDENMIKTVIRNLLDNSLKYSGSRNKPIEISVIRHKSDITIQIEDFGQGIPEDKLALVFEPFYRVDQSRSRKTGGYGLGLHLCKQIMDMHGADIAIRNKSDCTGIIVTLRF